MTKRHVVGHRIKSTEKRNVDQALFTGNHIVANFNLAIRFAGNKLQHLTLSTATGTLVHKIGAVVVRVDDLNGRAVGGDPALFLAFVKQNARSEERRVGKECRARWWRER